MNLLLLFPQNMLSEDQATVSGRQLEHMHATLNAKEGDQLTVGLENGAMGKACITQLNKKEAILQIDWNETPLPPSLPLNLIVALPRPKMLKRIIQSCTALGVKQIYFINAWKVEKSYWQSPWLKDEKIRDNCILGLEQAKDTRMPAVHLRNRFKPFVEDELPAIAEDSHKLIAHPGVPHACPVGLNRKCTLAIGPEGGFTPYEVGKFQECGFEAVHLGPRILRVETAVTALLARLFT